MKKFYITTPIYYTSGNWHLGHCYTTVACDAIARFHRQKGEKVYYLTGTDEHGEKVAKEAAAAGMQPKVFTDGLVEKIKELWRLLKISNDGFIRTTDEAHITAVQKIFTKLYESGDIYKSEYEGLYCTPCEAFWTQFQAVDGKCPDCGREVQTAKEESYFFRLSKYADRVRALLTETDFLEPQSRVNEMVSFIDSGLNDLAVTRTSISWGVPVPFDNKHVIYVWIDALSNYITALGYPDEGGLFREFWPADVHMVGKEIVRFHAVIWPAILMALGLPLPKKCFGHGWLLLSGGKMSKSKGNVINPFALVERYGLDPVRYYLLREVPFGTDGVYSLEAFVTRINNDLVNDLGNLVSRTAQMIKNYFGGVLPSPGTAADIDRELIETAENMPGAVGKELDALRVNRALEEVFKLVQRANKYIDDCAPWKLFKDGDTARLATVMYNLAEAIRFTAVALEPFLTEITARIFERFQVTDAKFKTVKSLKKFGQIGNITVEKGENLFPRLDIARELLAMGGGEDKPAEEAAAEKQDKKEKKDKDKKPVVREEIDIDTFSRTELRTARVLSCEHVAGSDKLLKLTVDAGEARPRTIVSGIAKYFSPEELVGINVVIVANLKPVTLRGVLSEGMILAASRGDKLTLVSPGDIEPGSEVR